MKNENRKIFRQLGVVGLFIVLMFLIIPPLSNYSGSIVNKRHYVPTPLEKEVLIGTWNGDMPEREIKKSAENPEYNPGGTYNLKLLENNQFILTDEKANILLDEGTYAIQENSESDHRLGKRLSFTTASGEQLYYGYLVDAVDVDMYTIYLEIEEGKAFYIGIRQYID
jgi:hypothetical protein